MPLSEGIVSIQKENLEIEIEQKDKGGLFPKEPPEMTANVRVTYVMLNETDERVTVPIAFPQPRKTKEWGVRLDEEVVPITGEVDLPLEDLYGTDHLVEWVDPRTGEEYEFRGYSILEEKDTLTSKTFNVSLSSEGEHLLVVDYKAALGIDEGNGLHPIYRFDYLLHPASNWSDFQNLVIETEVPVSAASYISLPIEKNKNVYFGMFRELPKGNLTLFVSPDPGFWSGLFNERKNAILFTLGIMVVFIMIMRGFVQRIPSKLHKVVIIVPLFLLSVWIGYDIWNQNLLGYPLNIFQGFLFGVYVFGLCVGVLLAFKLGIRSKIKRLLTVKQTFD